VTLTAGDRFTPRILAVWTGRGYKACATAALKEPPESIVNSVTYERAKVACKLRLKRITTDEVPDA